MQTENTNMTQPENIINSFKNVAEIKYLEDKTVVVIEPESCNINFEVEDDANIGDPLIINVSVQIKHWIVDNKITDSYYIITYSTPNMNEQNKIYHPFYDNSDIDKSEWKGDIIKKNAMTEQMVNYLMMDEDELSQFTGNTMSQDYKGFIMKSLTNFWD